ncbi:DUF2059 domain-containing protein [Sphingomonas bacterium]|uniref:DUF2059 domain-containing protein n=1 Tax=Sphingomonas bacterium TaxID=1895847 RepID=UPI002602951D|nr:DUF2059 domain-containing protein [Sphingomonas bacterium]MDB5679291.1 hypothetical protein [Sphingomonas bacterium]
MIAALLFAAVSMAPQVTAPVAPPIVASADSIRHGKAVELAKLLNPESRLIDPSGDDYVANTKAVLIARGKLNDLEAQYPGVIEAMLRASVSTMNTQTRRRVPVLWDRLADIYMAAFTSAELDQMLTFYGSPTGQRMMASLDTRMKPKAMMGDMVKNDDFSVSVGSLQSDLRATVPGVVADMSATDKTALLIFMRTSAFGKIAATSGKIQQETLAWAQEIVPKDDDELQIVMIEAMQAYIKSKDAKSGATS